MTRKEALYNSKLSVLAYSNKDQINWDEYGLELVKWIENKKSDTQGFVATKDKNIYVVWRGSESKKDFQNDASIDKVPFIEENEKVHIGFKYCWESVVGDTYDTIDTALENLQGETTDIVVCGHSLGGAVATLYAYSIKKHYPHYNVKATTIGSPRVGNKAFKENYDKSGIDTLRIVHNNDLVTHTPYIGFHHVNYQVRLDTAGNRLQNDKSLKSLWLYLKSLFSGKTIKDHMGDGYMKALENWLTK
jgi:predicted lipase